MIPKIIHFCWIGGTDIPEDVNRCIDTWKKFLPDYEIMRWSEENFDVNIIPYTKEAYEAGRYAFVSDYIRLFALYNYGGIYMDTDVEVLKNLDPLLQNHAFTGFEDTDRISAWLFGSEKNNPLFKEFIDSYSERHFVKSDGSFDLTPNPVPITQKLTEHGLLLNNQYQELDFITIYPMDYFCPYNPYREGKNLFTKNTYMNHLFNGTWKSGKDRFKSHIKIITQRVIGKKNTEKILSWIKR